MERRGPGRVRAGGLELPRERRACILQASWTTLAYVMNSVTVHGILSYQTVLVPCPITWHLCWASLAVPMEGKEEGHPRAEKLKLTPLAAGREVS